MMVLNVSFGIFAFMPQGWLFMAFVIVMESVILTKFLKHQWFNERIYAITTLANIISGIVGFAISMALTGGWWLVVWLPWVSNHEVHIKKLGDIKWIAIYYACAFILTIIIELLINWLFLKKYYKSKQIVKASMIANIVSYAVGTVVLYSVSFNL